MSKLRLGKSGEALAEEFLISKKHEILERNYKTKFGEIDLISRIDDEIHFVEVKTRSSLKYGFPSEAVTSGKIRHMRNVAEHFIQRNMDLCFNKSFLFDVIEIEVNYIKGV